MLTIREYARPKTMDEAMALLKSSKKSQVLGGCAMLRLGDKTIDVAVDLSDLGLDGITQVGDTVEIGAMATLHQVETDPFLKQAYSGALSHAMRDIVGVQFRNIATLGGSVYGKFAFSDPNTALLALNTELVLYGNRRMTFEDFLTKRKRRFDILEKIILKNSGTTKAAFDAIRSSRGDFALLNAAASVTTYTQTGTGDSKPEYRIAVGIRPRVAKLAVNAMSYLNEAGLTAESARKAAQIAAEELEFGTNLRASKIYREAIAPALIQRTLLKLLKA
jgi:CO/xanthine dehydrogenase FAD-binding subunit